MAGVAADYRMLALLTVAALSFGACGLEEDQAEPVPVPDVAWMSLGAAEEVLAEAGLSATTQDLIEDRSPWSEGNWIVVAQRPAPGRQTSGGVELGIIKDDDVIDAEPWPAPLGSQPGMRLPYVIQVDRQQVNAYAVASSPQANFEEEAAACAAGIYDALDELLLDGFQESYCWLFRSYAAFDAAGVYGDGGGMTRLCWAATAGIARNARPEPPPPNVLSNDLSTLVNEGCP